MLSVRQLNKDDTGSRITRVKIDNLILDGHVRAETYTDFRYTIAIKNATKQDMQFPNPIIATTKGLTGADIDMLKNPRTNIKFRNYIRRPLISSTKPSIFIPKFKKGTILTDSRSDLLTGIQNFSNINFVTVYEETFRSNAKDFEKRIVKARKDVEIDNRLDYQPIIVPSFSMGNLNRDLLQKLKVIEDNGFKFMNVSYSSVKQHFLNYWDLRKFAQDKDICIINSDVPKTWNDVSTPHLLQIFGIDWIIPRMSESFAPEKHRKSAFDVDPGKVKRFSASLCGNVGLVEHLSMVGEHTDCDPVCFLCGYVNRQIDNFYDEFHRVKILPAAAKAHECHSSHHEFKVGDKYMGDFMDYIKQKELLIKALKQIFKRQTKLFYY